MTNMLPLTRLLVALLALTTLVIGGCASVRSSLESSNSSSELGTVTAISVSEGALGGNVLCAAFEAGTAYCWEEVTPSQGDGDAASGPVKKFPMHDLISDTSILNIGVSLNQICALLKDETVRCVGMDEPIVTDVSMLSTGSLHACAVLTDGSAQCWGNNDYGQLGDGTTQGSTAPVKVQELTDVTQISAGRDHTCAALADGTAHCWGMNRTGLLGDDSALDSSVPVPVQVKGLTGATEISSGESHTCAATQNGAAHCWGDDNYDSKIGPSANPGRYQREPAQVSGMANVSTVASGRNQTCAALQDGSVYCWGAYDKGNVDARSGILIGRSEPNKIEGLSGVTQVAAGNSFACALSQDGSVHCWGSEFAANLGDGTTGDPKSPVQVSVIG